MSKSIKSFSVGYNPINSQNVFSSGDCITGQVTLELSKDCKIKSLCVTLKGKAEVYWDESNGQNIKSYHEKQKFFSIKQIVLQEGGKHIVECGSHVYPFTFRIPTEDLPSSFKGKYGRIVYSVVANLSRSMRADSKAKAKFTLLRNEKLNSDSALLAPQQKFIEKKMKLFSSGTINMDVNVDRTGYLQGEDIKVVASIQNKSSRDIKLKYLLESWHIYFAEQHRRLETKKIVKEVGEAIPPSAGQTVTRVITIPPTTPVSILYCKLISVQYILKVYLDVKYASDPEIKFPIVILPAFQQPDEEQRAYGFHPSADSNVPEWKSFQ